MLRPALSTLIASRPLRTLVIATIATLGTGAAAHAQNTAAPGTASTTPAAPKKSAAPRKSAGPAAGTASTAAGATGAATAGAAPRPRPAGRTAAAAAQAEADAAARAQAERARADAEAAAAAKIAAERAEVERLRGTTVNLIRLMVEQGVLDKTRALELLPPEDRALLADVVPKPLARTVVAAPVDAAVDAPTDGDVPAGIDAGGAHADPSAPRPTRRRKAAPVRVPYVPETVKNEIRDQIRQDVLAQAKAERWGEPGALPEWLDRIAIDGDLRVRHQFESYAPDNVDPLTYNAITNSDIDNTQQSQQVLRFRARIGLLARINEHWGAAFRLATGNGFSPLSSNTPVGDQFRQRPAFFDRMYIKWDPSERWSAVAGRFPNPFFWPTELIWDEDLNFDGFAGSFKPQVTPTTTAFVTAGWLIYDHQNPNPLTPNPRDKTIGALQGGGDWRPDDKLHVRAGIGLFDFRNAAGLRNT
ncbi:MAG: putative porin, partial [Burkholderiales bacterium]|nr:putative porin [Burkholderiales bacterium]